MERLTKANIKDNGRLDGKSFTETIDYIKKIVDKLEQLEDIEEELGIDLITLFKALMDVIYVKYKNIIVKCLVESISNVAMDIYASYFTENEKYGYDILSQIRQVNIKDYGKTWALTREELEK